jgi:hypothetical protein
MSENETKGVFSWSRRKKKGLDLILSYLDSKRNWTGTARSDKISIIYDCYMSGPATGQRRISPYKGYFEMFQVMIGRYERQDLL